MKRLYLLIIVFLFLFFPSTVLAYEGIDDYYIEATVTDDGDMHVKELFVLNGVFNGYERIINYKNSKAPKFNGSLKSFKGSDIYNASDIEIISIKDIDITGGYSFDSLNDEGYEFIEVNSASLGDYGVYVLNEISNLGYSIKIYNPSGGSPRAFYIEYLIKDIVINHNDVSEAGLNIFSDEQKEYIDNLEMIINIPGNKNELRAWGHGPLHGEVDLIGKDKIKLKIEKLAKNTAIDVRFVFDNGVSNALKKTEIDALNYILEVEKKLADDANKKREAAARKEEIKELFGFFLGIVKFIWFVGLFVLVIRVYRKYDKEYKSTFKTKYYRDFPANYGPEIVGYLFNRKISNNELSGSILNLINKKVINYEEVKKKNFLLKCNVEESINREDLTSSEKHLIKWIFNDIGNGQEVNLSEIKKAAKKDYNSFLGKYEKWKNEVLTEANSYNFYENNAKIKAYAILYCLLGFALIMISESFPIYFDEHFSMGFFGVIAIIYFALITKRTRQGNDDYQRWMGLKRFLNDFGRFKTRDLPEIVLWEKYLVYATVFGIAKKLSDKMKIKINELGNVNASDIGVDLYHLNMATRLNVALHASMASAYQEAVSTQLANTRSSSSGGFGGGFSGGGGSFGGGGGGGRF